ncbi:SagB family peptide dehydrogenase [Alicyclobacillus ferrooxydans]|uniref:Nitroreductase domain-containing protein n=1 Tax=Alicyclobacillus ferrooxydans TaxID=471514 RepID=A0A0N8PP58_9BACL|nr:SagB family peptide dehydrogenase [Alicyclobacillus ferrooxydans]KPV43405.1 hypothetical protein AN477_12440 [Alicyclobacillus ferrooxydans]
MELDEFLYNLHFDIDKVRPVSLEVDWEDAPLPFKLYQGLPHVHLSLDVPLSLPVDGGKAPDVKDVGDLCWYSYGLTQLCHALPPFLGGGTGTGADAVETDAVGTDVDAAGLQHGQSMADPTMQLLRRYVPSGGGLYPSELYVYLTLDRLVHGIYHYDVAHHRLVLLREGDFDAYLERALGHRIGIPKCFATFFVSTMFWKNYYKYHDFSYRLQALDAGGLTGQLMEAARHVGYKSTVSFQFLDRAVNHLIGLNDEEESVYAVISFSAEGNEAGIGQNSETAVMLPDEEVAAELCAELPPLKHRHFVKSKRIAKYPLLVRMNQASMNESTRSFGPLPKVWKNDEGEPKEDQDFIAGTGEALTRASGVHAPRPHTQKQVCLPRVDRLDYDFAAACRRRFSPGPDFVHGRLQLEKLSHLFAETAAALDERGIESRVSMGVCVHGIDGLNDGAYIYDATAHTLKLVRAGDHRLRLQSGMSMPTVNFFHVPVCVHLIGCTDGFGDFGYRGYRLQQLEVGMVLQRLLLTASALGMNGHPLLGYDESDCDDIYGIQSTGYTCLIEVPVGFYRKTSRFEGPLRV